MWIYLDTRAFAPTLVSIDATDPATTTTWRDAWLMIQDAVSPFPEAAKAVLAVVNRLIAECDRA